jgi:methyl-accepting chemotaxis protein
MFLQIPLQIGNAADWANATPSGFIALTVFAVFVLFAGVLLTFRSFMTDILTGLKMSVDNSTQAMTSIANNFTELRANIQMGNSASQEQRDTNTQKIILEINALKDTVKLVGDTQKIIMDNAEHIRKICGNIDIKIVAIMSEKNPPSK